MIDGIFTSIQPIHPRFISGNLLELFKKYLQTGLMDYPLIKINKIEKHRFLDFILQYYSLHNHQLSDLKSLEIVREIFCP